MKPQNLFDTGGARLVGADGGGGVRARVLCVCVRARVIARVRACARVPGGSVAEDSGGSGGGAAATSRHPPVVAEAVPNVREGFGRPVLSRVLFMRPPPGAPPGAAAGAEAGRLWVRDDRAGLSVAGQTHRSRRGRPPGAEREAAWIVGGRGGCGVGGMRAMRALGLRKGVEVKAREDVRGGRAQPSHVQSLLPLQPLQPSRGSASAVVG
jgi:hypothetical protein